MSLFYYEDVLEHKQGNTKGSKWGYNYGKSNGKKKAGEGQKDANGIPVQSQSDATFDPNTATIRKEIKDEDGNIIYSFEKPKNYEEYNNFLKSEDKQLKNFYKEAKNEQHVENMKKIGKNILSDMLFMTGPYSKYNPFADKGE